jgi:hypothetical protein
MSIEVNATEQIIEVNASGDTIGINVISQTVDVNATTSVIDVEVSNGVGPAGPGVPSGGLTGQVLKKLTGTDYDTYWAADTAGVPYLGATGNVDLGEYELKAGQLTLDVSPTGTAAVGTTRWNNTIGSSETTLKGGSVILKNGVDLVARVVNKVSPNTTLTKAAYQAVRISGAQGQRLAVALAQANNDNNSADTIGLVTETIAPNQEGFIITVGQLEGINTTGSLQGETWSDGDVLYLSPTTAGALTNVKPIAPQHIIVIGYVEYAHQNNGKLYVKVMNGWELGELHDVDTTGATNGQVLAYDSALSIWKPATNASGNIYTTDGSLTGNRTVTMGSYSLAFDKTITIGGARIGTGNLNPTWQNTYFGYLSMGSIVSGAASNTALGAYAMYSNVSGDANTAIGNEALYSMTDGYENTFVGDLSGNSLSTGSYNTGIGSYALDSTETGNYNTAVGYGAECNFPSGSYNTILGAQAYVGGNLSGANNTVLGARVNAFGNRSNHIYLGDGSGNMRLVFNDSGDAVLGGSTTYPTFSGFKLDVLGSGRFSQALTLTTIANATTDTDRFLVSDSGVIKYRTGAEILSDIGAQAALTNPITGTGTSGQVAYWSGTNTQTGSNNLFWDNANVRLGIGTTTPLVGLHISKTVGASVYLQDSDALSTVNITELTNTSGNFQIITRSSTGSYVFDHWGITVGSPTNSYQRFFTSGTEVMRLHSTGNLALQNGGTFTDSGQRLQVNGDTLLKGSGNTSATFALTVQNSDGTNALRVRNDALVALNDILALSTTITVYGLNGAVTGINLRGSSSNTFTSGTRLNVRVTDTFSPTSGTGINNLLFIDPTINQTGGANGITRGLLISPVLTAAADWRSIEWSNNSGWGLYGAGTSNNYLAGSLGIGTTTLSNSGLRVNKALTGSTIVSSIANNSTINSDVTSNAWMYVSSPSTQAAAFTVGEIVHFNAFNLTIGAGSAVTNHIGFRANSSLTSGTNVWGFYGDIAAATGRWNLYMNGTANNYMAGSLGIGTTNTGNFNLRVTKNLTGSTLFYNVMSAGTIQSDVTSQAHYFRSGASTANATFTLSNLYHFGAVQDTFGASSTVTSQYGFWVDSTLINATNNYGFFGAIPSGTNRWNLYMSGTASNHVQGNLLLGSTTDGGQKLQVTGTTQLTATADSVPLTISSYSVSGSGSSAALSVLGTWNTTGNPALIYGNLTNTASGGSSALLRLDLSSSAIFTISSQGVLKFGGVQLANSGIGPLNPSSGNIETNGVALGLFMSGGSHTGYDFYFRNYTLTRTATSGTNGSIRTTVQFNPTSGTGTFDIISVGNTINQTGGANGITRGLYVNPNLTSAADWRAIEAVSTSNANHTLLKLRNATVDVFTVKSDSKIGFFNATPVAQATTGIAEATFVENSGGTAVNVDSTFAGYTLQQIAQALKDLGLLA